MMAKPMKTLELYYTMIKFLITLFVDQLHCIVNYSTVIYHHQVHCTLRQQAMLDILIQYSNMVMRLSGSSIFGGGFFCFIWELLDKTNKTKIAIFTQNPPIPVRILIYRMWSI